MKLQWGWKSSWNHRGLKTSRRRKVVRSEFFKLAVNCIKFEKREKNKTILHKTETAGAEARLLRYGKNTNSHLLFT